MKTLQWALRGLVMLLVVKEVELKVGITKDIVPYVIPRGNDGRLTCYISQLNKNVVHWYFLNDSAVGVKHLFGGDNLIATHDRNKYELNQTTVGEQTTSVLTIRRTSIPDGGMYQCMVQILGEPSHKWPKRSGLLTVAIMPWIRKISSNVEASEGGNVTLECNAAGKPKPKVSWHRKNGHPIQGLGIYGNESSYEYVGSALTLKNITKGSRGVYVCTAVNDINKPAFGEAMVNVMTKPTARAVKSFEMEPQGVYASANLECIIGGSPRPTMTWYRTIDGYKMPLFSGSDYDIESIVSDNAAYGSNGLTADEVLFRLHIVDVDSGDYDEYTCEAVNPYGIATAKVRLLEEDSWAYDNQGSVRSGTIREQLDRKLLFVTVLAASIPFILMRY
ncbi:limbic system-associated membrane protein [Lingula anatina]|uniref:Limbic system-associated membrane protein n=1 Tax=Lingula anatina TaxID=7574 RepID=A0A1S3HT62_LINAN|nr:limbic system-associated membrane protein [Lingula anatina]|eukprot:XP_013389208.1 limbic system-associated membrane protein [Lingula anatina]